MTKYRARVDSYLNPTVQDSVSTSNRAGGEMYVNLVQHISSSMSDLGIEMLAWRYGNGGTGWNFWDETGPTGTNSFVCFRFHSSSFGKFDCLIYENTGSYFSPNHTGSVYIEESNVGTGAPLTNIGIAFAVHPSGSVTDTYPDVNGPWNGTYGENADINTSLIWKLNSEGKGAFFPRTNGISGQNSGSRDHLVGVSYQGTPPLRMHTILSEDSITIITDQSNDGNQKVVHFGPYLPRSGSTPYPESPYFFFTSGQDTGYQPWGAFYGSTLGSINRTSTQAVPYGAISHPDLLSGSRIMAFVTVAIDQSLGYNNFVLSGSFDNYPVWAAVKESTDAGILGQVRHLSYGNGMNSNSVSTLSSSAAFGRQTLNDPKLIIPWDGDAPNTSPQVRTGRNFSIG